MPTWTSTTTGGSWNSPGTTTLDCNAGRRTMIINAFNDFINDPALDDFPGLEQALRDSWDDCEIDCTDNACDGTLAGRQSGNKILICPLVFTAGQNRVNAVFLHELVHHAGGRELDSEAVEYAVYEGAGATAPTPGDFTDFNNDPQWNGNNNERRGDFAIWNRDTGQVWGIVWVGGGWTGPTRARGNLVFTDTLWIP